MSALPPNWSRLGTEGKDALLSFQSHKLTYTDPTMFPTWPILIFIFIWAFSRTLEWALLKFSTPYKKLNERGRRNAVSYVVETVVTTIVLAIQLTSIPLLGNNFTHHHLRLLLVGFTMTCLIYLWEVAYRLDMRYPLIAHHFAMMILTITAAYNIDTTLDTDAMVQGNLLLFCATTEQLVFIGLLLYRLGYKNNTTKWVLYVASIQSAVCKVAANIGAIVFWGLTTAKRGKGAHDWNVGWGFVIWAAVVILLGTQIWSTMVTLKIGRRAGSGGVRKGELEAGMQKKQLRDSGTGESVRHEVIVVELCEKHVDG